MQSSVSSNGVRDLQEAASVDEGDRKITPSSHPALGSFTENLRFDIISGLLVFLIALPLCLGISVASGFPAINGVFTAIVGGLMCVFISNSELTIKGPAAGMIAIIVGAATDFSLMAGVQKDNNNPEIYMQYLPMVAAVAVVAGVIQILFGLFRAGSLADFFPSAVIHGLLASIGFIIIGKQLYVLLGLKPNGSSEAYEAFFELPAHISHFAWQVALIGVGGLLLLFVYPFLKSRFALCKIIPAQLIILVVAIPLSATLFQSFEGGKRSYSIVHHGEAETQEVKALLVKVPANASAIPQSFIFPNFSKAGTVVFWKWVVMFALVGTLESLLSAKAVDVLDPWKRKSDLNRDMLAVGVANTAVAAIGGIPMISEIVRSSANRDYGARTRWANFAHGAFLLLSIIMLPFLLNMIPLTALAAMLVYAGCRLANYKEFLHMLHIGKEQLLVFVATIIGVLATDLLIGVGIGIALEFVVQLCMGVSPLRLFSVPTKVETSDTKTTIRVLGSTTFSNWLSLRKQMAAVPKTHNILLDCSRAKYIDHTAMSRLEDMKRELSLEGRVLEIQGLERHRAFSHDPLAARKLAAV